MHPSSPPPQWPNRHPPIDFTNSLPEECLESIFTFLTSTNDRNNASLVSHRWLRSDARTRTHLSLEARSDLQPYISLIFTRFNSLTHLVLNNTKSQFSINDNDIILITAMCPHLTSLELYCCEQLTDLGISVLSKNCTRLKEFSCHYCKQLTDLGMVDFLNNSTQLEVLSVTMLFLGCGPLPNFHAPKSLKSIDICDVYSERFVITLIIGNNNLKTLKLYPWPENCGVDWDRCLEMIQDDNRLVEVLLGQFYVTDVGFSSLSKCRDLIELSIVSPLCTDTGLICVAENCKGLKKLCIVQMGWDEIGDQGLIAVGKHSLNLQELDLQGVNASCLSLEAIATNCQKLLSISIYGSETITDLEMSCIAEKCVALKILCIKYCAVSNKGIEAFWLGCPNLVSLSVKVCRKVTHKAEKLLRKKRGSLVVEYMPF